MKVDAGVPAQYAMRVEKLAQNVTKQQGQDAVALIEAASSAAPRPVGPNGEGSIINTTA